MPSISVPDYTGGSLVNLVAELEHRLIGGAPSARLHRSIAEMIPAADTYVVVLFDGLGDQQLDHPHAGELRSDRVASIDVGFPTTTTVSLATIATGLVPRRHGLIGYQLWLPEADVVLNTIRWTTLWGEEVAGVDPDAMLPGPNLWERLAHDGAEPITVQPANFAGSGLSRTLYRGGRYEGVETIDELVAATTQLAAVPRRLIFTYLPHVDFAAHVHGQDSAAYAEAVRIVDHVWSAIRNTLRPGVTLVGVADHGHVDFPKNRQVKLATADHKGRTFYGDGRVMFVRGEGQSLADHLPATWLPIDAIEEWWGPKPEHPAFAERKPDGALVADDEYLLLHRFSDDRMIGNHGGLTDAERLIPLLAWQG